MVQIVSWILNLIIVVVMAVMTVLAFYREGKWTFKHFWYQIKYFTFLSNELCAVSALLMVIFPNTYAVWIVKFVGTAAVTLTLVTVLFFLSRIYGFKRLLTGRDFWMHLVNPVLALVSFCIFERREMPFVYCLFGLIPVVLYGAVYCYKVMFAKESRRWEDFYGFNKSGKWYLAVFLMPVATFAICVALWAVQKIPV